MRGKVFHRDFGHYFDLYNQGRWMDFRKHTLRVNSLLVIHILFDTTCPFRNTRDNGLIRLKSRNVINYCERAEIMALLHIKRPIIILRDLYKYLVG